MRLIDADKFILALMDVALSSVDEDTILDLVDSAPTVDAAPVVHGKWKYYHKQNKAVCTRCSFERDLDENFGSAISCPNCGVRMDGGADNETD